MHHPKWCGCECRWCRRGCQSNTTLTSGQKIGIHNTVRPQRRSQAKGGERSLVTPAQLTTAFTSPSANIFNVSSAAATSVSDVTSVGENTAPMDEAAFSPSLDGRSAITTLAAMGKANRFQCVSVRCAVTVTLAKKGVGV